jgi:tetratricopeptide (TPR) repeat protein
MKFSTAALAALLMAGTAGAQVAQLPRTINVSREEERAIAALAAAAAAPDRAAQDAALAAARSAARSAEGRYAVAHYQLVIARARSDGPGYNQAVDALVESGLASPEELPSLLANQAMRAYSAGDMARTDRLLARAVEIAPNNVEALADYAQFKSRVNNRATAAADRQLAAQLLGRALEANRAAGRASPESLHRRALAVAYDGTRAPFNLAQLGPQVVVFARALVAAYPSQVNWRDALLAYRDQVPATDTDMRLDIARLIRATGALAGDKDYVELAQALRSASLHGEVKAVLDEGVSRQMLDAAKPEVAQAIAAANRQATATRATLPRLRTQATAGTGAQARAAGDAFFGFGQYPDAAELYRLALQKGGEDPNLVNSRLGAALALAGRRPEAEAALRAVTGPRADLAGFWLAWLSRRPAA